jgi:hypothetical protein
MSTSFLIDGAGSFSHLLKQATSSDKPAFTGVWCVIELQPDIFVPQWFNIGIAVQSAGERLHFKILDEFKKFDCVYGDYLPQSALRELRSYAESAMREAVHSKTSLSEIQFETPNLRLSVPHYTSGDDREVTVERLFDEVVVMTPSVKKKESGFISIDTNTARKMVNEKLKEIAKLDYERIVLPDTTGVLYRDGDSKHYLDLNLRTKNACGSVVSAVYKSIQHIEFNLLKSSRDLTTYRRLNKMDSDIGLFLLIPDSHKMDSKEFKQVDDLICEQSWKLERDGFRVVSGDTENVLAQEIYEWALPDL